MKVFKLIDCIISLLIIILCIANKDDHAPMIGIWACLFAIGVWHVISMLVHYFTLPPGTLSRMRSFYHYLAMIAIIPITLSVDQGLATEQPSAYSITAVPVLMAFFYTGLCIYETNILLRYEKL